MCKINRKLRQFTHHIPYVRKTNSLKNNKNLISNFWHHFSFPVHSYISVNITLVRQSSKGRNELHENFLHFVMVLSKPASTSCILFELSESFKCVELIVASSGVRIFMITWVWWGAAKVIKKYLISVLGTISSACLKNSGGLLKKNVRY